jgi:hypothetical protein
LRSCVDIAGGGGGVCGYVTSDVTGGGICDGRRIHR